jgi:RHS repeat-associated protein
MALPGGSSGAVRYDFTYGSGSVQITAASDVGGSARSTTTLAISAATLVSITDPDLVATSFEGSSAHSQRIVARTDKRGVRTTYAYAPGITVSEARTVTFTGDTIALGYTDARAHGVVVASGSGVSVLSDSAFTRLDGPRKDVADLTTIWENALGAPVRTRDALGGGSRITYNVAWPGLAAEVRDPAHLVSMAYLGAASGLLDSTRVVNPFGDGRTQTTSYVWNSQWRAPTRVVNPAGDFVDIHYDGNGNRLWQQPTGDSTRRVNFGYNGAGQVVSVTAPGAVPTRIGYDQMGNADSLTSPMGWLTLTSRDGFGRDTLTSSPIDSTHRTSIRTTYDSLGRVATTTTRGPAIGTLPADSMRLSYEYDNENNRTATNRWFMSGGLWQHMRHSWTYDAVARLTQEVDDDGQATQLAYDPAGNVITRTSPRGTTVRSSYDALNHPTSQVHSAVSYSPSTCGLPQGFSCSYTFPTRGSSVTIVPDTAIFGYDPAGRLAVARNRYARVARSYAPNGALVTDELRIRRTCSLAPSPGEDACPVTSSPSFPPDWYTGSGGMREQSMQTSDGDASTVQLMGTAPTAATTESGSMPPSGAGPIDVGVADDFLAHIYTTRFHYDLNGRRDTLFLPIGSRKQSYYHHPITGDLESTIDAAGYGHSLTKDVRGRVTGTSSPSWSVVRSYDEDDNVIVYNGTNLTVDAIGRVTYASGPQGSATNVFDGLGHLRQATGESTDAATESFGYDALGNRTFSARSVTNPWVGDDGIRYTATTLTGKVLSVTSNPATWQSYVAEQNFDYDASGNATSESGRERTTGYSRYWESRSYYGADDKLRVFNQHTGIGPQSEFFAPGTRHGLYEEYWYDALGRRILRRSRFDAGCAPSSDSSCASVVTRTVWDGDQVLHEFRAPGSDSTGAAAMDQDFDFVTYTHLAGIDAPVAVMKGWSSMVVPHANWRAVFDSGNVVLGTPPQIRWPGRTETLDQAPNTQPHQQWAWYGELIGGMRDGSGQKYMRNRYYDPSKGTFTQKDPIGLAGGVNLYGYSGGDPVTYSDPFGLCPEGDNNCEALVAAYSAIGATAGFWFGGGTGALETVATGGLAAPVAVAQTAAATGLGAAAGGLLGEIVNFATSATSGDNAAARGGRAAHGEYSTQMSGQGYTTNRQSIPGTKLRPDAIDPLRGIVRELKPNTASGIARGTAQLQKYVEAATKAFGREFQGILDFYTPR